MTKECNTGGWSLLRVNNGAEFGAISAPTEMLEVHLAQTETDAPQELGGL